MSVFSRFFHSRDKPEELRRAQDTLGGSRFPFFFGGSTSGKPVNERTALQMTAVYSCVRILSEAVAGLPLHVYRYGENGSKVKALDHPLYRLLHDEPNPEMTSFNFRETLMGHLLLYGNAYAQIIRNGKGEVIGLYPLMPTKMTVDRDSKGQIYYLYTRGSDDSPVDDENGQVYLPPEQVLHIPGLGYDGIVGYSPIAMAKNAVGMAIACEEYGAKFFANDAAPGGVLEHPGVLKNPDKVRESWNKLFRGSANSHQIAVLEEGLKYQPIGISPEQAQGQHATPQSDIYSLGIVAYEGLCGHRPFTGATPVDIAAAHVNNPVPPLPDSVDVQLREFVMSMLSKDPLDRPKDALTVSRTLSRIERRLLDQQTQLADTMVVPTGGRLPRRVVSRPHISLSTDGKEQG